VWLWQPIICWSFAAQYPEYGIALLTSFLILAGIGFSGKGNAFPEPAGCTNKTETCT